MKTIFTERNRVIGTDRTFNPATEQLTRSDETDWLKVLDVNSFLFSLCSISISAVGMLKIPVIVGHDTFCSDIGNG